MAFPRPGVLRHACRLAPSYAPSRLCYASKNRTPDLQNPSKIVAITSNNSHRLKSVLVVPINNSFIHRTPAFDAYQPVKIAAPPVTAVGILPKPLTRERSLLRLVGVCAALSKARLTGLVVSTAVAGCALAAPTPFACEAFLSHPAASILALSVGTGLTSGAANAINQIMEVPFDSMMKRTQMRPLVRKSISPVGACVFASTSAVVGLGLLHAATNPLVASLAAGNLLLYTCVYTPLKRISEVNTWVGSVVGAIPPLMGWAAATGSLEWGSLVLASLLYAWQFPHFMALSWLLREDYARAGYVMTANVNPDRAKRTALRHSVGSAVVCLAGAGCSAVSLGPWAGWSLGLGSLPFNAALIYYALEFYRAPPGVKSMTAARRLFRASLVHLPAVMAAMLICSHWSATPLL